MLQRAPYAGCVDLSALTFAKRGLTTTDLVTLVLDSRLDLVELHVAPRTGSHPSGQAVVDLLEASSFGDLLRIVSEELRPSLRADLASAFDAQRGPGGVVVRDWGVLVVATRPATAPDPFLAHTRP